jgi:nicotinate-nucleotide--dimethylbenzimidazole phosphoribosyltransferase
MFDAPDALARFLATMPASDVASRERALARQAQLTKPPGSLGRLEEIAIFLSGWQGDAIRADQVQVALFAGNHGVTAQGVSPYPSSVTWQMVENFRHGGAAINSLSSAFGLNLSVLPLSLDEPTGDISVTDAMSASETLEALNAGARAISRDADVLVVGEMGIGNTTIAAALCAASLGGNGLDWAGAGTGLDSAGIVHKAKVIDRALVRASAKEPFEILRQLGGREIAAIAGAVCAARARRLPVILDGFVTCAAVAPLFAHTPAILEHCLAGHRSAERGHARLLERFNLRALLDLDMRLGEGSGAALAVAVLRAAVTTHTQMATFAAAGVSDRAG